MIFAAGIFQESCVFFAAGPVQGSSADGLRSC